ncbi:MAG: pseudouridine synthase [Deltaproteobacteria bacterium]|nr:pseudouridine synthase [Deltaproteobacteria bacterium]
MAHGKSPKHVRSRPKGAAGARPSRSAKPPTAEARAERSPTAHSSADESGKRRERGASSTRKAAKTGGGAVRLQKLLAAAGYGSRRNVERFLTEERVTVNGRVAELGDRADPLVDEIRFDGERLARERPSYWIVNKPRGVVTTVRDDEGRRTVIDLLPRTVGRVFPVGRLDRETSGLLLLTNDGDTAHAMLHPSLGNEREYRVSVKGRIDDRALRRLERGVTLEEGRTASARVAGVRYDPDAETTGFLLTLMEGRKRQIRRSLLVLGFPVRRLVRVRMGPLRLGRLAVGEARPLRSEERRALLAHAAQLRGEEPARRPRTARAPRTDSPRATGPKRPARKSAGKPSKGAAQKRGGAGEEAMPPRGPRSAKKAARKPARSRGTTHGGSKKAVKSRAQSRPKASAKPARARPVKKAAGRSQRVVRSRKGVKR